MSKINYPGFLLKVLKDNRLIQLERCQDQIKRHIYTHSSLKVPLQPIITRSEGKRKNERLFSNLI
jgi:hypothetical protein